MFSVYLHFLNDMYKMHKAQRLTGHMEAYKVSRYYSFSSL